MTDIYAEVTAIIDRITAAGIRAANQAADLNPPCVQVIAPALNYRFGGCSEIEYTARVMVHDTGADPALRNLGPFLAEVVAALGGAPTRAEPDAWTLPDGTSTVGYTLTWSHRPKRSAVTPAQKAG